MSFDSPFRKLGQGLFNRNRAERRKGKGAKRRTLAARLSRLEPLEERQLLTWVATFASSTGQLTIQGVGLSSDTGVLKVDPGSGNILLDGNNSGNFVQTGANLATINTSIQIEANTTINSNFIIDNKDGAFFEAPATFPALTPLFVYTGSTARQPNSSLTITGQAGIADTFNVTPDSVIQNMGVVVLSQAPNVLGQQNVLTVDYAGVSGHLSVDGVDGQTGADKLIMNEPSTTAGAGKTTTVTSDWTLNGNEIAGPQFPAAPTIPPTPAPLPGTVGDFTYSNIASLNFANYQAKDLLTINAVATSTTASDADYTVVNYNQPLAAPVNLIGLAPSVVTPVLGGGTPNVSGGTLIISGAVGGNNDFYADVGSVIDAPAGTKPQYNTPFTHLGSDLTFTPGTLAELLLAGNGGNNTFTIQVPAQLIAPYTSQVLPYTIAALGGSPPPLVATTQPPAVVPGTSLLRVLGNAPTDISNGSDDIQLFDYGGLVTTNFGGVVRTNGGYANIQMSNIAAAVVYGEGGNDVLTNNSGLSQNVAGIQTQPPPGLAGVPALLIGGTGNDTLTGGAGSDMFLGGGGQDTIVSRTLSTVQTPTTTYFFPHQDQFGNIYDPLLNPAESNTTSTLTGPTANAKTGAATAPNIVVVTGAVDPSLSETGVGDLDLGNLANAGVGGAGGGGGKNTGGNTVQYATVPPGNVTAPLYMVTPALTALEQAMGIVPGPFPANTAAVLEFGAKTNLTSQFASYGAFVGRAYADFLVDRGGNSNFGNPVTSQGVGNGKGGTTSAFTTEGISLVSPSEIDYWVGLGQQGMTVQQMQAQLLASNELQSVVPDPEQWIRFLWQSVTGQFPSDQVLAADDALLSANNSAANRYGLALSLLMSPIGQIAEINDAYANTVPGGGAPSGANLAAMQADLSSGESLPQIATTMSASLGNYFNYETTNQTGFVGFVAGAYESILHRPANTSDLTFWASESAAGLSNAQIATVILDSAEARSFIINDAYEAYLGRPADPGGMAFWQSAFAGGMTDEQFIGYMIASNEYYAKHGGTSQGYVTALYQTFLSRSAMQSDIDYWVSQLAMSTRGAMQARADIAVAFQRTPEFRTKLIDQWYQLYDGRAPSAAELNAALAMFAAGATQEGVQAQILAAK